MITTIKKFMSTVRTYECATIDHPDDDCWWKLCWWYYEIKVMTGELRRGDELNAESGGNWWERKTGEIWEREAEFEWLRTLHIYYWHRLIPLSFIYFDSPHPCIYCTGNNSVFFTYSLLHTRIHCDIKFYVKVWSKYSKCVIIFR